MATKTCRTCNLRKIAPRNTDAAGVDLCNPCYDFAGWENTHSDQAHQAYIDGSWMPEDQMVADLENEMAACWVCHPELRTDMDAARAGHHTLANRDGSDARTQEGASRRINHAECKHPRTPAGRVACRKAAGITS